MHSSAPNDFMQASEYERAPRIAHEATLDLVKRHADPVELNAFRNLVVRR
jgi:hypothetical protein